ncbi:hypothetical protein Pfo_026505 [Paulownia fortunei]|nr:hypothetical protein Pfo_026505 [Paulownia fortunei]
MVYPKVKVRVQREEADQYAYEKSSLQSLKAFEWLSLHHFSSSEETNKKKAVVEENQKNVRPTSAPRPRAVLSSPDNDGLIGTKTQARRELLSGLKNHTSSQNRHTHSKIFPKSAAAVSFAPTQGYNKESAEPKSNIRAKGRTSPADSSIRAGHRKKITPSSAQS